MVFVEVLLYVWELFKVWIYTLFVIPVKTIDMLWLLVPIWLAWFFAEFYQEKTGTSMGNAMSNSVVIVWACIDCTRQTVRLIEAGTLTGMGDMILRFVLLTVLFSYGVVIVIMGWKGNKIIQKIGRIREVTYIFAIFVPIFYNEITFSVQHILAAIIFFPLFYFMIELIDRCVPNPKAVEEDIKEAKGEIGTEPETAPTETKGSADFEKEMKNWGK